MAKVGTVTRTRFWYALTVALEAVAQEAVAYALMEAGALGTEVNDFKEGLVQVTAYFDEVPDRERVRTELLEGLRIYGLPSSAAREMEVHEVAEQDWLGEWKKSWQPVAVGERFIIAPPWTDVPDSHGRLVIRIEPGMAFGTGTHETTRLCLTASEKYFSGGSFLDVGTGSGILAIAAAKLFPDARVEACDIDEAALAIARENARLNGVANQIAFRLGTVDANAGASADCVCANLTAPTIVLLLPSLLAATCRRLILSGILDSQIEMVTARLQELSVWEHCEIMQEGEWAAIVV